MCVVVMMLTPEFKAILEAIEIIKCLGERDTACERDGAPKIRYSSGACARRGVLLQSWRTGTDVTTADAVYECTWCGYWHHTVRKARLSNDEAALAA
jgi:hypothetical protein